ncbi:YwaF family protein [Oceanirhabdus sp. W0125-5]|uniref:YwaF family protein n=1 Tax=Oceanirhabdus sp. W0125-5 TaxID=2999116 RepID=UPI0022F3235D|nr:TIGR02206 family membrane protein [Oceanirhabdus sp. W0125-5]WBW97516.1 TIGR02206 family membrane protein [Oceanirhabdus sp. W0125-5]
MNIYNLFWGENFIGPPMRIFSLDHIIVLIITLLFIISLYFFKKRYSNIPHKNILVKIIGYGVIGSQILMYLWYIHTGWFNIHDSLPLYISRITSIVSGIMILTNSKKLFDVIYFWGLIPPFIALMLPEIEYFSFPHIRFWFYFIGHAFTIFAVFYMLIIEEMKPNFNSFKKASIWLLIYCAIAFIFNVLTNSNYGYLMNLPSTLSGLEKHLTWPFYLPILIGLQIFVFYLTYIPFKKSKYNSISEINALDS